MHILEGRMKLIVAGVSHELKGGESFYLASDVPHGVETLEDTMVLDTFSPPRDDYIALDEQARAQLIGAMLSFIVPAYNEELELPSTLSAIHAAAAANEERYEIIVVDDASTDATAQMAASAGAVVVRFITGKLRPHVTPERARREGTFCSSSMRTR